MTPPRAFASLASSVADLSRALSSEERFQRLLKNFESNFSCDAIALLQLDGEQLVPRAVSGLSADTLGRRFLLGRHPRLAQIMSSQKPVRFPSDSSLSDPYDGLIENVNEHTYVHDCIGAPLYVDEQPWGAITLDALSPGAFDAIDFDVFEAFLAVAAATVRAADWIQQLETRLERHRYIEQTRDSSPTSGEIVGDSLAMKQLLREAETVAASDLTVLILGETGVGKELVARFIHKNSSRSGEPMIQVNCAALPESLAESELFGHARGAFSGATDHRMGKFELAHEGTLFLDEIGELSLAVQAKLLRVLQDGDIQRPGSDKHHRVDVRLIAATNRDLKQEVAQGRFRADLYHRLSVYPLTVPPIRERREDILLLAGYLLTHDQRRLGLRGVLLSEKAKQWLANYDWPGNIRELEHTLSRGVMRALSNGGSRDELIKLDVQHLSLDLESPSSQEVDTSDFEPEIRRNISMQEAVDKFKRRLAEERLHAHGGNRSAAAKSLNMDRANFYRLLKRLDMI